MNIYYSRSKEVNDSLVEPQLGIIVNKIREYWGIKADVTKYQGGAYDKNLVTNADLIIVGITEHDDRTEKYYIGKGCYTEIRRAFSNDIPVAVLCQCNKSDRWFLQYLKEDDLIIENASTWSAGHSKLNIFTDYWPDEFHALSNDNMGNYCILFGQIGLSMDDLVMKSKSSLVVDKLDIF